jgi:hypothetical protein
MPESAAISKQWVIRKPRQPINIFTIIFKDTMA